ncbi:MAG: response regulator transcription factor, partial [Chloroflexi bacterium]|nr:response regulator transcription factor [Chloroflexota bacterium]
QEGYDVTTADDGEQGLSAARTADPDLIVLDLMLPRLDGYEVARRIRRDSDVPILMLTARDSELDKVVGLEIGADDYLAKPFSMRELIARVRALLRRPRATRSTARDAVIAAEGLVVDTARHRVTRDGRDLALTAKEFDLLSFLIAHPGQVFSRDQLLSAVWGLDHAGGARAVDTQVKALRARLGDEAARPRWIETVRGVGYRFREANSRMTPSTS